jgi:hypothetical protein
MLGKASFMIIGWVGYVHYLADVTEVEIGRAVPSDEKDKDGNPIVQTEWTTVTVKDDALCAWICEELNSNDLVVVEGQLRDGLCHAGENADIPVEKSDLVVEKLDRLAMAHQAHRDKAA